MAPKGYSGQLDLDDRVLAVGTAVNDALYGYSPVGPRPDQRHRGQSQDTRSWSPPCRARSPSCCSQRHGVTLLNADFIVFNASSILDVSADSNKTLTILLAAVAGISLLVGGIGVMNIMLVSVTERTREIGIRKAIGADRKDIVGQFLGEAVFLSLAGGVLGVGAGFIATQLADRRDRAGDRPLFDLPGAGRLARHRSGLRALPGQPRRRPAPHRRPAVRVRTTP